MPEFSPEFRLLLASALYPLQGDEIERLHACCSPNIDWHTFDSLIARHRLIPTVYRNLSSHMAATVPEPVLANLKEQANLNRQRIIQLLVELNRISQWFALEGIKICALKGPLLAQRLFGDAGLRTSRDLDLLVEPESLMQADELLQSHGYQRTFPPALLTPRQRQIFLRDWRHMNYFLPDGQIYLELHWTIASSILVPPEIMDQIFSRACPATQSNNNLYLLANEDLLPFLLIHGSVHRWARLKWLVDFVVGLRQIPQPDWKTVKMKMEATGMQRALAQGVLLAQWFFPLSIPESIQAMMKVDANSQILARISIKGIMDINYRGDTDKFQRIKQAIYLMRLKNGLRHKWKAFRTIWLIPNDWRDLPLPDVVFPLYWILRPFFWLRRLYRHWRKSRLASPPQQPT